MLISDKKKIPLSLEKCEEFKPKKEKEIKKTKEELQIENNDPSEEETITLKDIPRRKSSTNSTSLSKPEDISELFSNPETPVNTANNNPLNCQQNGIFFGRDRNCSNPVFNFYQNTEEHIRESHPEYENYKKSKNFLSKNEVFLKKNEISENKKISNNNTSNTINTPLQNNNIFKNQIPTTPVVSVMGAFGPKVCNGVKGKFDLPMYYVGFYGWDSK